MCVIIRLNILPADFLEYRTDGVADIRTEIQTFTFGVDIHTNKVTALFAKNEQYL
jgi:hypothetical protein